MGSSEFVKKLLGKHPPEPFTRTGRPGEVFIPTVGVRRLTRTDVDQIPLYYGVTVPPRVEEGARFRLFERVAMGQADPFVTNIPLGDRFGVGTEAIIYRVRIGFAPEADLSMSDVMGVMSTAYLYLKFTGSVVEGGLMFFHFSLYAGVKYSELVELIPGDEGMVKIDQDAEPPEGYPYPKAKRYVHRPARLMVPIHVRANTEVENPPQFEGNLDFKFQSKNAREVKVYVIMDSLLTKPLR